jgi:hypothetical protein
LFLCGHGAHVNAVTPDTGESALHLAAKFSGMKKVAETLITMTADPNSKNDLLW